MIFNQHCSPYIIVIYGFVLFKFVKPYIQSVLFKTVSLHDSF